MGSSKKQLHRKAAEESGCTVSRGALCVSSGKKVHSCFRMSTLKPFPRKIFKRKNGVKEATQSNLWRMWQQAFWEEGEPLLTLHPELSHPCIMLSRHELSYSIVVSSFRGMSLSYPGVHSCSVIYNCVTTRTGDASCRQTHSVMMAVTASVLTHV